MGSRVISLCTPSLGTYRRLLATLKHVKSSSFKVSINKMAFSTVQRGSQNADNYRLFFRNQNGLLISPFHDIPLLANADKKYFNMVVEIPRWTNAKMEINKEEKLNPLKQDVKKGKLRYVKNIFPHHGYIWNYGALPQTYEDPAYITPDTGCKGDTDPIDVCEIGQKIHERGAVIQVKALGILCLIDEEETDWKVLAIDISDPLADKINDLPDIEANFPGLLRASYEWFKYYKIPDEKPENQFAFNGEAKNREYALHIIEETHNQWKSLITATDSAIARENTTVAGSPDLIDSSKAEKILANAASPGPTVDVAPEEKWHYVIPQK
uniref:Inorganic pyrophosphatase n=1 Tax=Arion vulgaris TaxID=1028688 RepID=A0A0B6ZQF6_9EUPU